MQGNSSRRFLCCRAKRRRLGRAIYIYIYIYICIFQVLMGFSQLPMLETVVPLYLLLTMLKNYILQSIFSLLVVLRIVSIFPNWMGEYILFCFNILKKIVSEVEHFLKCFLVIFISYTLPIFLVTFPCWLLRKWSEVAWLCLTVCHPMDCSLPGSTVHGIFQARILDWATISFSRGSSQTRDRTRVSYTADRRFTVWATR